MNVTVMDCWYKAYVVSADCEDPHKMYATLMGIDRQEAKLKALQIAYNISTAKIMEGSIEHL